MFGTLKKGFQKLVEWLDFPPPRPKPGVSDVHWEFMGDLLGELAALSDTETETFLNRDFSDPNAIRELADSWIRPVWARFMPSSREKIMNTLDYYLASGSGKTDWILPSYGIPLAVPSARLFFGIVRETLSGSPPPATIELARYRENRRQAFANTLYSDLVSEADENGPFPDWPERKGLILPGDLERHAATQPLERLRHWAETGTTPDGVPGLPRDAARWNKNTDTDAIREMAAARFARQKHARLGVYRLTLSFTHTVGEGYLARRPDTLVTTRKARCIIDRLGFMVRCYPVLRG
ncbi:hypothetical protein [Oxalobacter paraformigenes]|uniref:Uncharacterized protein n=1 Tax=Oxalobacter paraformigenes TaxID=556268 RepID=C3X430_9BURK|nr:hypothetical protein [Oxalobacter paraformigenes]EEO27966.1 hypothetical protein OFAG_01119 [Oxalobacter paraformigenes]